QYRTFLSGVDLCRGGWSPGHGPDAVSPLSGLRKSPTKGAISNKDCSFSNLPLPRAPSGTRGRSYKSSALHALSCNLSFTLSFNFAVMLWPRHRRLAGTSPEGSVPGWLPAPLSPFSAGRSRPYS
ncbi:hypothetical protein GGTG_01145, partial [Gaeumannomyces tritici R3-111a-1]